MARAIWKGSLAFGLVNIPIELYRATREHRPKFRLLHAKYEAPVGYERVCQKDGKAVGWEDLVKGYEYEKGRYNLMKVIRAKLKGHKPRLQERETPQSADVVDLMARLRASPEGKAGTVGKAGKAGTGKAGKAAAGRVPASVRGKKKAGAGKRSHAA